MRPADRFLALALTIMLGVSSQAAWAGDDKPGAAPRVGAPADRPLGRAWLTDLGQGRAEALRLRRPILVRLEADWCAWCRKLAVEIARPEAQKALGDWTVVALDVDKNRRDAESLGAGSIPALRIMKPSGQVVASRDGFLTAGELVSWLVENHDHAANLPPAELAEAGAPSAVAVVRLVRQLDQSDALVREAAINRLEKFPREAAAPVAAAFATGALQTRLAALELLAAWNAPVAGLDPWRPATLTESRLAALRDWSTRSPQASASVDPNSPLPAIRPFPPAQVALAQREINRLIAAEPADVAAILERLARVGRALLPSVRERLKGVDSDRARERLTALRLRLAAGTTLALRWPGGLERLSATDARTRHQAVDELLQVAGPGDEPLFLELFNDSDPLVRETALRGLSALGEAGDSQPLLALLADPEPNVRAAVLKQLAEHPSSRLMAGLAEYVARETDPDLVGHTVRVLAELSGSKPLKVLVGLLSHENWSVRAEAVEAIGKKLQNSYMGNVLADDAKSEAYAALTERLEDPDGFVVGRVLAALKNGNLLVAVQPLLRVADNHPELAAKVIETLFGGNTERPAIKQKALPKLRKFAVHPRVDVRAAVVRALGDPSERVIEPEVLAALSDRESEVRIAAARTLLGKLNGLRPQGLEDPEDQGAMAVMSMSMSGFDPEDEGELTPKNGAKPAVASVEAWLSRFQEGKERPAWMQPAIALLTTMLKSASPEAQIAAALPLAALGPGQPDALPTLIAAARARPDMIGEASQALPWLHLPARLRLFQTLLDAKPGSDQFRQMASQLAIVRDTRVAPPLWNLAAHDDLDAQTIAAIDHALRMAYLGSRSYTAQPVPKAQRAKVVADARARTHTGTEWQRLIALSLLLSADPGKAAVAARSIKSDSSATPALRRDAFAVLLISGDSALAQQEIKAALQGREPAFSKLALYYLLGDSTPFSSLRDALYLRATTPALAALAQRRTNSDNTLSEPIPKLPKEVTPALLRPMLKAGDSELAALAGFALALLGEPEGLEPLLDYWRKQPANHQAWDQRVYQAVAQLGDDSQVPALEKIYSTLRSGTATSYTDTTTVKDLYWTIRGMDGPNARRLRQRIRTEVGMPVLRGEASEATNL